MPISLILSLEFEAFSRLIGSVQLATSIGFTLGIAGPPFNDPKRKNVFILSGNIRYILWVKGRIGISEEKVRTMEKGGAVFLIVYAIAKLLQIIL
jgi:hypothetical protein